MDAVVQLQSVSWRRNGQAVLCNIDWEVHPQEHWAVIGANGAGKTTLLNIVTGYVWPSIGAVRVFGHRFGQVSLPELRRRIGWVSASVGDQFQAHAGHCTALEVAASGRYATIGLWQASADDDAELALSLLAMFAVDTLANRDFASLSQGEKARVLLARAWMAKPDLLILDEPCNGLDIPSREHLLAALVSAADRADCPTLLYVTHHVEEIAPFFNRCLVLKDGAVLASGQKESVLTDETLSRAFAVPLTVSWSAGRPWVQVTG